MKAPAFVTESWLRQHFGLAPGSEVHLPKDARLTPSANQLLAERQVRIKYIDAAGRVYIDGGEDQSPASAQPVHPLTGGNQRPGSRCAICAGDVQHKTELLTLLDDTVLVPKTHPRIGLRGKLDTLIAQTVMVQTQFDAAGHHPTLSAMLADLRSYMGNLLRSEVTGGELPPLAMGELDCRTIHRVSHQPLKYLGHDHIVPEVDYGSDVALLNLLRAQVREVELAAARVFVTCDFTLTRPDIIQGLNRLSSALYVLMLMRLVAGSATGEGAQKAGAS